MTRKEKEKLIYSNKTQKTIKKYMEKMKSHR